MSKFFLDLVVVGVILGVYGVCGDVCVKSFIVEFESVFDYVFFLLEIGMFLIMLMCVWLVKDYFIVLFEQFRQKEEWDVLKGIKFYVLCDVLLVLEDDEFYIEDLVGLDVYMGGDEVIGWVKVVFNYGVGDLIEVQCNVVGKFVFILFILEDVFVIDFDWWWIVVVSFEIWVDDMLFDEDC